MNFDIKSAASADAAPGALSVPDLRTQIAMHRMGLSVVASVSLLGAILLLPATSAASAPDTPPPGLSTPIDVMDIYLGVVALDMNRCCDCHRTECR